jgi:hypothetical protein
MSLVTEAQMRGVLLLAEAELDVEMMALWEAIRIEPEVWTAPEGADYGFGYWAVGLFRGQVVWFNSHADGFHRAAFATPGQLPQREDEAVSLAAILSACL